MKGIYSSKSLTIAQEKKNTRRCTQRVKTERKTKGERESGSLPPFGRVTRDGSSKRGRLSLTIDTLATRNPGGRNERAGTLGGREKRSKAAVRTSSLHMCVAPTNSPEANNTFDPAQQRTTPSKKQRAANPQTTVKSGISNPRRVLKRRSRIHQPLN